MVAVFESEDVYDFLAAADVLRRAGVSFTGVEHYTGEFRPDKRAQAPYVRALLVPQEREEDASLRWKPSKGRYDSEGGCSG